MNDNDGNKVQVRLVSYGNITDELDIRSIEGWKSKIFEVVRGVKRYTLPQKGDLPSWGYSDELLYQRFSANENAKDGFHGITFFILDAPIEDDCFTRILPNNYIVITYFEAKELLQKEYIPLENYLISNIYTYALLYRCKNGDYLMEGDEEAIAHDYREGCLYDFCGQKGDIIYSCVTPKICEQCQAYLINNQVSKDDVDCAQKELKRLCRTPYWRVATWLKKHPVLTLLLSFFFAFLASVLASMLINFFCDRENCCNQITAGEALKSRRDARERGCTEAYYTIGVIYGSIGDFIEEEKTYRKGIIKGSNRCYVGLGNVYYTKWIKDKNRENKDSAKHYYETAKDKPNLDVKDKDHIKERLRILENGIQ